VIVVAGLPVHHYRAEFGRIRSPIFNVT
jgi:hypothetical protein